MPRAVLLFEENKHRLRNGEHRNSGALGCELKRGGDLVGTHGTASLALTMKGSPTLAFRGAWETGTLYISLRPCSGISCGH